MTKLFKQEEKDEAAFKYNPVQKLDNEFIRSGVKAGIEFAESKVEEIAIEFAKLIINDIVRFKGIPKTPHMYFEQFIKEKNE